MKVSYEVTMEEIKRASTKRSEEHNMICKFLESDKNNMCFEYDSEDEAKNKAGLVSSIVKKINADEKKISYAKRNNKIYIMKAA